MCRYCYEVHQHADLGGAWAGWKLRGAALVAPTGERLNPRALAALAAVLFPRQRFAGVKGRTQQREASP